MKRNSIYAILLLCAFYACSSSDDDAQKDAGEHRRRDQAGKLHIRQVKGGIDARGDGRHLVVAVVADELRGKEQRGHEKDKMFTLSIHSCSSQESRGEMYALPRKDAEAKRAQ